MINYSCSYEECKQVDFTVIVVFPNGLGVFSGLFAAWVRFFVEKIGSFTFLPLHDGFRTAQNALILCSETDCGRYVRFRLTLLVGVLFRSLNHTTIFVFVA